MILRLQRTPLWKRDTRKQDTILTNTHLDGSATDHESTSSEESNVTDISHVDPNGLLAEIFIGDNTEHSKEAENPNITDFIDCHILPTDSHEELTHETGGIDPVFDITAYHDQLLGEYKSFLSDNPDWVDAHSGGDLQLQVMTSSNYFDGIELSNPGEAHAFDAWFESSLLAGHTSNEEEGASTEHADSHGDHEACASGTLILSNPYEHSQSGLLVTGEVALPGTWNHEGTTTIYDLVKSGGAGIPSTVSHGGTISLTDSAPIAYSTNSGSINPGHLFLNEAPVTVLNGADHAPLNTDATNHETLFHPEPLVTDKVQLVISQNIHATEANTGNVMLDHPIDANHAPEQISPNSALHQMNADGNYNIVSVESSTPHAADHSQASQHSHQASVRESHVFDHMETQVSASSTLPQEKLDVGHHAEASTVEHGDIHEPAHIEDLPSRIEIAAAHAASGTDTHDDIVFVDEHHDSHEAENSEITRIPDATSAEASHTPVVAALGGAFFTGSVTQAPTGRGVASKKGALV
jgi:hypothetical protein